MARILLIDDDPDIRRPVRIQFEKNGHVVAEASDGVDGLAQCHEDPPDLVICDILMPEMDGFETMRTLKKDFPDMPILVLSGSIHAYLDMAPDLGADFVLSKPFRLSALQHAASELITKADHL